MSSVSIVVFTRDLRVRDNPALFGACSEATHVLPLFVFDDSILRRKNLSPNRMTFLIDSLRNLDSSLQKLGSNLFIRRGNWVTEITKIANNVASKKIYISDDVSGLASQRIKSLEQQGILNDFEVILCPGVSVVDPGFLAPSDGKEYKVFTPYYRRWLETPWRKPFKTPAQLTKIELKNRSFDLLDSLDQKSQSTLLFRGGEEEGITRLNTWIKEELVNYEEGRNDLAGDRTSHLSSYLHLGCLSPLEVALEALEYGGEPFVRQLCWRDFYLQILKERPDSSRKDYRDRQYRWNHDPEALEAWKLGKTGFPIVDAGMRQLLAEGFMHNRTRMIVASFLTKDLHLDWREGANHFMQYLIDGDVASNQLNWQWVAGTGTDSNPHRIFNPTRQSERFDPKGSYIRKWVPELRTLSDKEIHNPEIQIRQENSYPEAIIDHHEAISIYKSKYSG